ncbi:MAG: UvrD-helicase domain-containing protein [Lentimicrobiaceae bacterium]|nr:UvrD-helicase domain-containing protein [Lentimicrobiaceae bacterium]
MNILEDLNHEQRLAVEHIEGPVMVLAGAGSGKTRVLTYKVAHLINLGIDPFAILALTFTNKAAREMKKRIISLVDNHDARNVWMGTFHSIFARILRIEAYRLGFPSNYTIYDTDDSKSLMKSIITEQGLDTKIYAPSSVLNRISQAKINLVTPDVYNQDPQLNLQDKISGRPKTGQLYTLYQNRLVKASAMDFDDLLMNMYRLLEEYPDVLYKYQQKFQFILVDEYQDTNYVQYVILKKLAANNENICVVGDDAQSIYAFRGANIQNILNFKNDYSDVVIYKLEQNYRSTKTIVKVANGVIVRNKDQIFKEIWTNNEEGTLIGLLKAITDSEEGTLVANSIFENKMNHQLRNDAFAILYRTNAQSRAFEESLRKLNIPYRIYGGLSFYKRKEIKDLLAYFRLVINNRDEEALLRIINYPARGIGKTSCERLVVQADKEKTNLWEVISRMPDKNLGIPVPTQNRMNDFLIMIQSHSAQLKKKNAYELAREIASTSGMLRELYDDKTPEGVSRFENIEELLNAIHDFTEKEGTLSPTADNLENIPRTLDEFMQEIALLTDADTPDSEDPDHVSLMTIHAAKGLEFPFVYIVGLEENLFPSIQSLNSRADLEEERRLFYVALTRAMKKVTLSYAENRYRWGTLTASEPSRFIDEIDFNAFELPRKVSFLPDENRFTFQGENKKNSGAQQHPYRKNFRRLMPSRENDPAGQDDNSALIQTGMSVEHARFGKGKVISIEGTGPNKKATIFFQNIGQKQLLLKYAKLRIL